MWMSYNDFEVEFSLKIYRLMTLSFIVHAERLSFQIYSKYMFNIDCVKPNIYSKKKMAHFFNSLITCYRLKDQRR